ncbi:Rop family plasmid primer RNA-binding protein [Edwardsiella ictaluri]|uniref:Rop family plasmid primer RNA-binding protein n=1 Tax=Edwardsiella ictaluri TaxID=67780 RepID=UPI002417A183|nr:Rop family plasmid primer RNA-binding protein [Edwardsiella ictaluri]WFO14549.1 Rop family plasmid primer RNA-binding protein [Edwardsiella ictaluri]
MTKQELCAVNMAKFIKAQTLILLRNSTTSDSDERANECEHLHEMAEILYGNLEKQLTE